MTETILYGRFPPDESLIGMAPLHIGRALGCFERYSIELVLQMPLTNSWVDTANGRANCSNSYFGFCGMPGLRGKMRAGAVHERHRPGAGFTAIMARPALLDEGRLTNAPRSMAGLRIGLLPARPDDYMAWYGLLRQTGLTFSDVTIVPTPHGGDERERMLRAGEVDLVIARAPLAQKRETEAGLVRLWRIGHEVSPGAQAQFLLFNSTFLQDRRDVAVRFLAGYLEAARIYCRAFDGGIDKDRVVSILAAYTPYSEAAIREMHPGGFDPDGIIDREALASDLAILQSAELLEKDVKLEEICDFRLAVEAGSLVSAGA